MHQNASAADAVRYEQIAKTAAIRVLFELRKFPPEMRVQAARVIFQQVGQMLHGNPSIIDGDGFVKDITPKPEPKPQEPPHDPVVDTAQEPDSEPGERGEGVR